MQFRKLIVSCACFPLEVKIWAAFLSLLLSVGEGSEFLLVKADFHRAVSGYQCYFYSLVHYFSVVSAQPIQIGQRLITTFDFGSLGHVTRLRFQSRVLCDQDSEPGTSQIITSLESCKGSENSKLVLTF